MTEEKRYPIIMLPGPFKTTVTFDYRWKGWKIDKNNPLIVKASPKGLFPYDKDEFEQWLKKNNCKKIGTYRKIECPNEFVRNFLLLRWA